MEVLSQAQSLVKLTFRKCVLLLLIHQIQSSWLILVTIGFMAWDHDGQCFWPESMVANALKTWCPLIGTSWPMLETMVANTWDSLVATVWDHSGQCLRSWCSVLVNVEFIARDYDGQCWKHWWLMLETMGANAWDIWPWWPILKAVVFKTMPVFLADLLGCTDKKTVHKPITL
jgi:hypothetical protein